MHGSDWLMGGMWIFWLAILVGLVLLARWVMIAGSTRPSEPKKESAEEILKKRYARGEIQRQEYEQKLQDLGR